MRLPILARAFVGALGLALAATGCTTASHSTARDDTLTVTASAPHGPTRHVLAISVDALNITAVRKLGRSRAPNFHRLIHNGSSTLNARTERERTITLPNHTGMLTGRRVTRSKGGHGVGFNNDRGHTVQHAAGHPVSSVFRVVHRSGRRTALFASKTKFKMFTRSWPSAVTRSTIKMDNARLVEAVRADLVARPRAFTFLHLSLPDVVGHEKGFMSHAYMRAVKKTDRRLGELIRTIRTHERLRKHLTLVLTADHGGARGMRTHSDRTRFANYRVPFIVWGAGVAKGTNLYDLNPAYARPGRNRTSYAARKQPVRNGDVANVALSLLGLDAVPHSEHDKRQNLLPYAHN